MAGVVAVPPGMAARPVGVSGAKMSVSATVMGEEVSLRSSYDWPLRVTVRMRWAE